MAANNITEIFYLVEECTGGSPNGCATYYTSFSTAEEARAYAQAFTAEKEEYLEDHPQAYFSVEIRECPTLSEDLIDDEEFSQDYYAWERACWAAGKEIF